MASQKISGIVVKQQNYSEFDQIITFITDSEVISFIALGVRKLSSKNRIALQEGNFIDIELFRATLANKLSKLKRANLLMQLPIQKNDVALVWIEVSNYLQKIDFSSRSLMRALVSAYEYWGREWNHHLKTYIVFQTLEILGFKQVFHHCVECKGSDRINGFEFYLGGYTCFDHTKIVLPLDELKGYYALNTSLKDFLVTSPLINKIIYQKLVSFINQSNF